MRAYVVTAPRTGGVQVVDPPAAAPGEVVVDVARVGVCGTDLEFYTGEMQYLASGRSSYPMRLGHEWCGRVVALGEGVDPWWLGRRVVGDTMLGCGTCERCWAGKHHVCERLVEVGISLGRAGALAEQIAVPATSLHVLPDSVDDAAGAMVEPGGNAWRAATAASVGEGQRALVCGPGTIGLLVALFLRASGVEVQLVGEPGRTEFAASLGFDVWTADTLPVVPWHAVVNASTADFMPARAVELVEPGGRVVSIGLSRTASVVDTRTAVLKDVTLVGVLGGSAGLDPAIEAYASGAVDPRPLIGAVVGLDDAGPVLGGTVRTGGAPKTHIDPRK